MSELKNEHIENIELRSEEVQEILTKVPHWMIRWGNLIILFLIVMVLAISWFIKYPDVIASQALVTTQIPPQKEYAKTTGEIHSIFVKNDEEVSKNSPLAIIENTADYDDVFLLKSIIDTVSVNTKSFYFPIDELPILFLGDIESDFALFENNYSQYVLNKQLQPYSNEAVANQNSLSELYRRLQNSKAQLEINRKELEFTRKNLERNKDLFNKGVISQLDYENKQLEFAQAERNYKNFETTISQIRESISNAKKTSKGTQINKTKEETKLLKSVIQSFNQLKKAVKEWEQRYLLQSKLNGRVSFLHVWNVNQTVNAGDLVFTIIPKENSTYVAKLKTPAQNSGKLKIGQKVNISIENYPEAEFGVLIGTISHISILPDTDGFYLLDVILPQELITSYNKNITFKQEMRGTAEIITEDLRLIERFFYQIKDIFKR